MNFQKHFNKKGNSEYIFALNLENLKIKSINDSSSRIKFVSDPGKDGQHQWAHSSSKRGNLSSDELLKNWDNITNGEKVYGSMLNDKNNSLLLFEYGKARINKNGKFVLNAKLHSDETITENKELFNYMYGTNSHRKHKRTRQNIDSFIDGNAIKMQSLPIEKSTEMVEAKFNNSITNGKITLASSAAWNAVYQDLKQDGYIKPLGESVAEIEKWAIDVAKRLENFWGSGSSTSSASSNKPTIPFDFSYDIDALDETYGIFDADITVTPRLSGYLDMGGGLIQQIAGGFSPDINAVFGLDIEGDISAGFSAKKSATLSFPVGTAENDFGTLQADLGVNLDVAGETDKGDPITGQLFDLKAGMQLQAALDYDDGKFSFKPGSELNSSMSGPKTNAGDFKTLNIEVTPFGKVTGALKVPKKIKYIGGLEFMDASIKVENPVDVKVTEGTANMCYEGMCAKVPIPKISSTTQADIELDLGIAGINVVNREYQIYGPVDLTLT